MAGTPVFSNQSYMEKLYIPTHEELLEMKFVVREWE